MSYETAVLDFTIVAIFIMKLNGTSKLKIRNGKNKSEAKGPY